MMRCGDHTQYLQQGPFTRKISCLTSKKDKEIYENFRVASAELNFCLVKKRKKDRKRKGSRLNLLVCEGAVDIGKGAHCNSRNKLFKV